MNEFKKKLEVLSLIYDFVNGGYFGAHHQLRFYDDKIYDLYLKNDKVQLIERYNELKKDVSPFIIESIEHSAGIRYFLCDDCHDARIINVKCLEKNYKSNFLIFNLDIDGMLGCLNIKGNECKIKVEISKDEDYQNIINDFKRCSTIYWLYSNIEFNNNEIYLSIELQTPKEEDLIYKFKIIDIIIE